MISTCYCVFFLAMVPILCGGTAECPELKCNPHGPPIRFPFRLKGIHKPECGYSGFDVSCTTTKQLVLELPVSVKLFISNIDYKSQNLRVYDPTSCLSKLLRNLNLSASPFEFGYSFDYLSNFAVFNCSRKEFFSWSKEYELSSCLNNSPDYGIITSDSDISMSEFPSLISCTKLFSVSSVPRDMLFPKRKIILSWFLPDCTSCEAQEKFCRLKKTSSRSKTETETECLNDLIQHEGALLGAILLLAGVMVLFRFYRFDKPERENQKRIKIFLEDYKALKPARYSYADIKRITDEFTEQLGQGTYGSVYKGKLSNEISVAIKVLNNSIGKGDEFINEVATMGTIHHVNIVRLVGYCADGFRRALVYEYLPKNSLQKYISSAADTRTHFLGWKKLQDIAVGVAKGIEYLHQGCDQRILHFDIKPHNILLDDNLNPKISDFGMAKLYSKDRSAVSMTAARGTMGYIAPEVFSRNFGNVSHKSDVYSFGMVILEMVGGRKNADFTPENGCQVYFPEWIYNLLEQGEDLRLHIEEEEDAEIAKKLAIVGLWCIQWHPVDRPSIQFVVQMLEGGENLTVPPNPFGSTGSKINLAVPGKRRHQELEVIQELE
ncbi:rust resistance kinase Lr10-like isoform X2 [Mercurialis annua]|uniref:rust resistance kinase Lr10-like isoform X2 n=1 Tax=Mercurialis annua TaxID=3986 RepID=UPI00215E2AD6|nr:rust resistance kinase Lr10-like isoform X2 [Mercurialis annua]